MFMIQSTDEGKNYPGGFLALERVFFFLCFFSSWLGLVIV